MSPETWHRSRIFQVIGIVARLRPPLAYHIVTASLFMLVLTTCKESLPTYRSPSMAYQSRLIPSYGLTVNENVLHISIVVQNVFDETLEGRPTIMGQVQIASTLDPSVVKTSTVGPANVVHARGYNPTTGILTFDPRDTIIFDVQWDLSQRPLLDDAGKDLTQGLLHLNADPECKSRTKSAPVYLAITGFVQLFDKSGPAVADQVLYHFCLISNWVNQSGCPIVTAPCNTIVSQGK